MFSVSSNLILDESNVTLEEVQKIVKDFEPFSGSFDKLTYEVTNLSSEIDLSFMSDKKGPLQDQSGSFIVLGYLGDI